MAPQGQKSKKKSGKDRPDALDNLPLDVAIVIAEEIFSWGTQQVFHFWKAPNGYQL